MHIKTNYLSMYLNTEWNTTLIHSWYGNWELIHLQNSSVYLENVFCTQNQFFDSNINNYCIAYKLYVYSS